MTNTVQANATPQWPDFPEGCPPAGSSAPQGDYFRITNKRTPSAKCCATDYEKNPDLLDERTGLYYICTFGLSIQDTLEGARQKAKTFRNATRTRYIAKGSLTKEVGLVKQTFEDKHHHTLWTYDGVERHTYFKFQEVV